MPDAASAIASALEVSGERKPYRLTPAAAGRIQALYQAREDMKALRDKQWPQFTDRTLRDYLDDAQKRANAYVLPRSSQGKEDWQANFATRAYANKLKALLAATARQVPDLRFAATRPDDRRDFAAAEWAKQVVRYSYQREGNVQRDLFLLAWQMGIDGTVISYEGYGRQRFTRKRLTAFNPVTLEVSFAEETVESDGGPVTFAVPLLDFLISDWRQPDVQQQPAIVWDTYYPTRQAFLAEWGGTPASAYVPDQPGDATPEELATFFADRWQNDLGGAKQGVVVTRYFNRWRDEYAVIANGVLLYDGPMLWYDVTGSGQKAYPFAKAIYEPFADPNFFYGNSLVNAAMPEGDVLNTIVNTALDKTYRSLVPPLLVGTVNRDLLDLEDEVLAGDTKVYVEDINQVRQLELRGVTDSELRMLEVISSGFNLTTLDPSQEGSAEKYVTARAAVAADERARQLKGLFSMYLEDLWLQKVRLRLPNALMSYAQPVLREVIGPDGVSATQQTYRAITVEGAPLSGGRTGALSIRFAADIESARQLRPEIEAEEAGAAAAGVPMESVALVGSALLNLHYDVQVVSGTLWQTSQALGMAMSMEKVNVVATYFPEYFAANKALFFGELLKRYEDDPARYQLPQPMGPEQLAGLQGGQKGTGNEQLASDLTGTDRNNMRLGKMSGVAM